MPRLQTTFMVLLVASLGAIPALGQSGVIQGSITDPQGAVIPSVRVTALDEAKLVIVRETVSGRDGSFQLRPLLPGVYTVRAEMKGFKVLERKGVVLDVNQVMNLGNLNLQMGETTESVTVKAEVPLVEVGTGQKSYVISSEQVTELSLNGRDFSSLMYTLPGVSSTTQSDFNFGFGGTNTFNVNGMRNSMNNIFLDGTVNTDQGDNGSQYTQLSLDAVGEFKVQNSVFNAEYGRNPGVLISATTKSGGKQFHGAAYEFLRNDALDANSFFNNLSGISKSTNLKKRFNQFGGNLGGPIPIGSRGNPKLFFFTNYEGTRGSIPNPSSPFVDVPNAALLSGDFRSSFKGVAISTAPQFDTGTVFQPGTITRNNAGNITGGVPFGAGCVTTYPAPNSPNCNVVPQSAWNQNAPAFLKILSEEGASKGVPTPGNPALARVPLADTHLLRKNQEVVRIDYVINPNTSFFFRWVNDTQHEEQKLGIFGSLPYPVYPMLREKPGNSWSWNLVKVLSPSMTNEFIFAYAHQSQIADVAPGTDPATYDRGKLGFKFNQVYPNSNLRNRFPGFNCGVGSCNFSGPIASGWGNTGSDFGWTDNFTFVRGAHTFKTGVYFNLDDKNQQPAWNDTGTFDFSPSQFNPNDSNNGLANLLFGNYSTLTQSNGYFFGSFRFIGLEFYGQDTWKVSRRLTLEFGARYAYLGPTYTYGKYLENYFSPALYNPAQAVSFNTTAASSVTGLGSIVPGSGNPFNGMVQENSNGIPSGFGQHRKNQVSPRFGFAYDPFGDGKTSIRGGFGTFFERVRQNVNSFDALGNPPLLYTPRIPAGNIDNVGPGLVTSGFRFPVEVRAFAQSYKTPTTYSWSFGVQRQFGARNSLDVSYSANVGRHLQLVRNINLLPLGTTTGPNNPLPAVNNINDAVRPYKGYTAIDFTGYDGNSSYNSLQARLSRRFATNLTANVSYTFSKAIDTVDTDDNFSGCAYYLNCAREKGPSGFDRRHMLNIDYVYQLPKFGTKLGNSTFSRVLLDGWEVSGVTRFWSGVPFSVGTPGNAGTLNGNNGVRADYIGGSLYPDQQTRLQWFNPLAFAQPLNGSLGNTGRDILRKPGFNNWNFSIFKNIRMSERVKMQVRAEAFNVANRQRFAFPDNGSGDGSFGGVFSTTNNFRRMQFGARFQF